MVELEVEVVVGVVTDVAGVGTDVSFVQPWRESNTKYFHNMLNNNSDIKC